MFRRKYDPFRHNRRKYAHGKRGCDRRGDHRSAQNLLRLGFCSASAGYHQQPRRGTWPRFLSKPVPAACHRPCRPPRCPVLLLDEATSALDVTTERNVLRNIIRQRPNKTCIVTTHRPSVLGLCQRVYRVMNGTVTELDGAEGAKRWWKIFDRKKTQKDTKVGRVILQSQNQL